MCAAKISFPGFNAPAAGFEAPLEMLSACHGRVESQCQTLLRLPPHLAANGPDQAAREAAQNIMRYFDTSARNHHADEEEGRHGHNKEEDRRARGKCYGCSEETE